MPFVVSEMSGRGRWAAEAVMIRSSPRRLSSDGLVEAYWGDESQGGRRKYYRITDAGRAVYRRNVADWRATQQIINTLLDLEEGPR